METLKIRPYDFSYGLTLFSGMEKLDDLIIDETNFEEYFKDVRKHGPKAGQVMAKFTAIVEFVEGQGKKDVIYLLKIGKVHQATMVMRKIHGAKEPDCYRVCREICEDLITMTEEEVENKAYEYVMELFYYTQKEFVPREDVRWETIKLVSVNFDEETGVFKSVINL